MGFYLILPPFPLVLHTNKLIHWRILLSVKQGMTNLQEISDTLVPIKSNCSHISEETMATGEWLKLNKLMYKDPFGKIRTWESAGRTTSVTTRAGKVDAVAVIAVYERTLHKSCLICVKQYRPPMKTYTIELPAGLVDEGEEPGIAAMRELLEETGFTGKIKHISPNTALDPGLEDCTLQIVTAEVDGDNAINHRPKQHLCDTEASVEVLTIPLISLLKTLNDYSSQGMIIDSRLYTYAIAIAQTTKEKKLERIIKLENC